MTIVNAIVKEMATTERMSHLPCWAHSARSIHSEMKAPNGGAPVMAMADIASSVASSGMDFQRPFISEISLVPVF